jgi:hypothetical protein
MRLRLFVTGLLAILALTVAGEAQATHDQMRPWWTFRAGKCGNDRVAKLVGMRVDDALKDVRQMRLLAVRVLDRWTAVNLETVPERLTMVVHDNGVVVRAFCR